MSQDTLMGATGMWLPVTESVLGKLQVLLGRQIAVTDDGHAWIEADEADIIFRVFHLAGAVRVTQDRQADEVAAEELEELSELAERVLEFASRPDLVLFRLGEDDWRRDLYSALHPASDAFVGRDVAREAAQMVLALADPRGDEGYLIDAARAALAED